MTLTESIVIGGSIYLDAVFPSEKKKPEGERVAFHYRALTERERIKLLHKGYNEHGFPDPAAVCSAAVTSIDNLSTEKRESLDTVEKLLLYHDNTIAYIITYVGHAIWNEISMGQAESKNLE